MTNEDIKFAELAALLCPDAYKYVEGNFSITVPSDTQFHVVNAFEVKTGIGRFFHRKLGIDNKFVIPGGTTLSSCSGSSFLFYADVKDIILSDSRYTTNPKDLYYQRINALNTMPLYEITATRVAGSTTSNPVTACAFPSDFSYGLISHISVMDLSWVILAGGTYQNTNLVRFSNCMDEINDAHAIRSTCSIMQPFINGMFPGNNGIHFNGIWCGQGSDGDNSALGQTRDGTGTLHYYKLPSDW